jgi:2-oxoisovalerate dehydrogenase E1 component
MSFTSTVSIEQALSIYRDLLRARYTDEKMFKLVRQNKGGTFQLASTGHELVGVIAAKALTPGKDWSCPYYRDQPFVIGLGAELDELFGVFMGRATKHHSSGRMMPFHFSHKPLRIFCQSSVVGSQILHAVGRAWAIRHLGLDEVVYVSCGDGATSQGDFHEALNFASIHKLPVIFCVQNNGIAISVPAHEQTAGGCLMDVIGGYHGLHADEVDGCDLEALIETFSNAVERGRQGNGPTVVMAHVPRLAPHSNSDDPKKYLLEEELLALWERDPIKMFERYLNENFQFSSFESMQQEVRDEVEEAFQRGEAMPFPERGSGLQKVFAPYTPSSMTLTPQQGEVVTMVDAINHALKEEMEKDPYVVVFGQDVAHGKGGVFGATRGLTQKFGNKRCFNTPLAESTIVGAAIGMGAEGLHKPVAEIQFADYLWTGINQLFNEASSIYYRSNGEWNVPIVLRMPCGGYIQGGPYHSQSIEGFLAHCPGLKVVFPSNAEDAKGLLKTAIRDPNPVLFLEHKALYRQTRFAARPEPSSEYLIPFGKARTVKEGTDVTVVTWGLMTLYSNDVAEKLQKEGCSVEVIDLRTLIPLDLDAVINSVKKTGKLLIVHEAQGTCGFGAEVAARISEHAFEYLDAPIVRVTGGDSAIPYSKPLEEERLPQPIEIEHALLRLMKY